MVDGTNFTFREKSLTQKVSSLRRLALNFELKMEGFVWDSDGETFKFDGEFNEPLAGRIVITKLVGLLMPFCEEANLTTSKKHEKFVRQRHEADSMANSILANEPTCPAKNQTVILKIFKSTLQNIGDIILDSKGFWGNVLKKEDDEKEVKDFV